MLQAARALLLGAGLAFSSSAMAQQRGLPACLSSLGECQGDLQICDSELASCDQELDAALDSRDACAGSLDSCEQGLTTCGSSLSSCNSSLSSCSSQLSSRTAALNTCRADLSECTGDLGSCQDELAAICPIQGQLQMIANFRDARLALGDTLTYTSCGLASFEFEVASGLETSEGEDHFHLMELRETDGDGISDASSALYLFRDSPLTTHQIQFQYGLGGLKTDYTTLLACYYEAAALGLCD